MSVDKYPPPDDRWIKIGKNAYILPRDKMTKEEKNNLNVKVNKFKTKKIATRKPSHKPNMWGWQRDVYGSGVIDFNDFEMNPPSGAKKKPKKKKKKKAGKVETPKTYSSYSGVSARMKLKKT